VTNVNAIYFMMLIRMLIYGFTRKNSDFQPENPFLQAVAFIKIAEQAFAAFDNKRISLNISARTKTV
jgi:hypothetical protein